MKTVFICSGLEPGRDGVGDYCRRLAGELIRQGHQALVVALNDSKLKVGVPFSGFAIDEKNCNKSLPTLLTLTKIPQSKYCYGHQEIEDRLIPTLRLSSTIPWNIRAALLLEVANEFKPDMVSLQYVAYGFHNKGLPIKLIGLIRKLKSRIQSKWHVMLHELAVGLVRNSSTKDRLIGCVQLRILKQILRMLPNAVLHTSNKFYQSLSARYQIDCGIAPLFGSFSAASNSWEMLPCQFDKTFFPNDSIRLVCFGAVHPSFPFDRFKIDTQRLSLRLKKPIYLLSVGSTNNEALLDTWKTSARSTDFLRVESYGVMADRDLRAVFSRADAAISLSWLEGWGKSSAIATMRESGLMTYGYVGNLSPKSISWSLSDEDPVREVDGWENSFRHMQRYESKNQVSSIAKLYVDAFNDR